MGRNRFRPIYIVARGKHIHESCVTLCDNLDQARPRDACQGQQQKMLASISGEDGGPPFFVDIAQRLSGANPADTR